MTVFINDLHIIVVCQHYWKI